MLQTQGPVWALLHQLVSKDSLKTLQQLQNDYIIQDFAKPVLMLIEKAFGPIHNEMDPILTNWASKTMIRKAKEKRTRLLALQARAGLNVHTKMMRIDDDLDELLTKVVQTSWFKVAKATFDNGPQIVCYPIEVERALFAREKLDPTPYDESRIQPISEEEFQVDNQHSQALFPLEPVIEEEEMEPIEIIAVTGAQQNI